MASTNRKGFLDLPPELRIRIYEIWFRDSERVSLELHSERRTEKRFPVQIFRVCKQLQSEAQAEFVKNDFFLEALVQCDGDTIPLATRNITSPSFIGRLHSLTIWLIVPVYNNNRQFEFLEDLADESIAQLKYVAEALEGCNSLPRLSIDFFYMGPFASFHTMFTKALNVFRNLRGVPSVTVRPHGIHLGPESERFKEDFIKEITAPKAG